jgi:hypothetical protein
VRKWSSTQFSDVANKVYVYLYGSWDSVGCIVTTVRAGRPRVRRSAGATDISLLQNVEAGSGAHADSYSMGTGGGGGVFLGIVKLTTLLHLAPTLSIGGAILILTPTAFLTWTGEIFPF